MSNSSILLFCNMELLVLTSLGIPPVPIVLHCRRRFISFVFLSNEFCTYARSIILFTFLPNAYLMYVNYPVSYVFFFK